MAVDICVDNDDTIELADLVDFLTENKIDPADHASLVQAAPMLKSLYNNRRFLAETVADDLKNYRSLPDNDRYSSNIIVLYAKKGQPFFLRACLWLSGKERVASNVTMQGYIDAHDHNYNFLTVGYAGPGYGSRYYEYEHDQVIGYPGEAVSLRFVEESYLTPGKVLLYRALRDVHDQIPPESLSVSINIIERSLRARVTEQYAFDKNLTHVTKLVNRTAAAPLFSIMAHCGNDEDRELLETISRRHSSHRIRFHALQALAHAAKDTEAALGVLVSVDASTPALVREWARVHVAHIERCAKGSR